jgi:hypothetical protein
MLSDAARARCMVAPERIRVLVVCAEAGRHTRIDLEVEAGCLAGEALNRSGILAMHPDIDASACGIGIFGREVARDCRLCDGDRVEVLRPLLEDPRERRRRLAKQAKTAAKKAGAS